MGEILDIEKGAFPKTAYSKEILLHFADLFPDTFVVACSGDRVVGYIIFDTGGHVISMAIKEEHRNKGFGKTLVMHALEHTRSKIWLEVRTKNQGAITFYKGLGMKTVGKIPGYYGNDDALIMVREKKNN